MTQHIYGDVSNLNAPYDNISVQGIGQTDPYPWREHSENTQNLQLTLNDMLADVGKCPLLVDGILGPRTCGAMVWLNQEFDAGRFPEVPPMVSTCHNPPEAHMMPTDCPEGAPAPPPSQKEVEVVEPKSGGIPIWVWGLGLGALAIGAAVMMKKKKGRR